MPTASEKRIPRRLRLSNERGKPFDTQAISSRDGSPPANPQAANHDQTASIAPESMLRCSASTIRIEFTASAAVTIVGASPFAQHAT